ncbi:MAG: aminotransferase class IV, partial [Candidatus Thermoplasmatota archaeon]
MRIVWLNGKLVPEDEARISPFDRGLLLGDGVFETMRAYDGRCYRQEEHLARLRAGCARMRLAFPEGLAEAIRDVLRANGLSEAAVRVTLTRGPGGRGASPRGAGPPTALVTAVPVPPVPARVNVVTAPFPHTGVTGVKTVDYVANVLARIAAEEAGADDAIFVDGDGFVVEATQANVFAFLGHALVTPPLSSGCLPGVTRSDV